MADEPFPHPPRVAVHDTAETVRAVAGEVGDTIRPAAETLSAWIRRATIQAPLQSLAVAFVLGALFARRRR
jgi:hypothetical protein